MSNVVTNTSTHYVQMGDAITIARPDDWTPGAIAFVHVVGDNGNAKSYQFDQDTSVIHVTQHDVLDLIKGSRGVIRITTAADLDPDN